MINIEEKDRCKDPACRFNLRNIIHTCGQCSMFASEYMQCSCFKEHRKRQGKN